MVMPSGMVMDFKLIQFIKAFAPMLFMLVGITIVSRFFTVIECVISYTVLGMVIVANFDFLNVNQGVTPLG